MDYVECLVKMILFVNVVLLVEDDIGFKRKKKGKFCEVVVYEFENIMKFLIFFKMIVLFGFLKLFLEFVEGKGWVDEDGNVVEVVIVVLFFLIFRILVFKKVEQSESKSELSSNDSSSGEELDSDSEFDSFFLFIKVVLIFNYKV